MVHVLASGFAERIVRTVDIEAGPGPVGQPPVMMLQAGPSLLCSWAPIMVVVMENRPRHENEKNPMLLQWNVQPLFFQRSPLHSLTALWVDDKNTHSCDMHSSPGILTHLFLILTTNAPTQWS